MNIYVFLWDNMHRWIMWWDLVGFDSPLLLAEVGCTLKISNERGVYTENWSVTYKDLSQILERGQSKKMRDDTYWSTNGWLSRGIEREKERKKNASPVLHGVPQTCPRINKQEMQLRLDQSPPPVPHCPKIPRIPNELPSFSIHPTQLIPAQRCGKGK